MATPGPEEERGRRRAQHFVSVAIRVRPIYGPDEPIAIWAKPPEHGEGQRRVCVNRGYIMEEYEFSRVFGPEDDNCELFRTLQGPAVTASVFSGVNETLFAYGQTGSGKTHTIFGTREDSGLLQLFVRAIFDQAEVSPGSTVHACCYEVLGDSLTDLISPEPLLDGGQLREEDIVYDEMYIKTQKCRYQIVRVSSVSTCLSLLQDARANRTAGISSCNAASSRSHAIVHLFVQNPAAAGSTARGAGGRAGGISSSIGALTLVDLAGTEKEHENPSEQGRKSARLLNTSLSSLNRLLRRLQTGGLDESERRQSVLNKCLWEYLRPGCGISLIFCVNPLLRHRAITLSTLAMATDSKLIHSQRKAQYIQLPSPAPQEPRTVPQLPQFGASSPSTAARPPRPGTPSQASAPAEERTPRGPGTPNRTPTARGGGSRGRAPDFCMTPQTAPGAERPVAGERPPGPSLGGASRRPGQGPRTEGDPLTAEELERLCGYDLRSPVAVRSLALQNTKLRRKLSRSRARSQERISQAERERDALGLENTALQHECESLRGLFLRQQQQQIAFWTGPFMEMIAPRESHASLAASIRSAGSGAEPGPGSAAEASSAAGTPPAATASPPAASAASAASASSATPRGSAAGRSAAAMSAAAGLLSAEEAREEFMRSLRRERDYWRLLATDLKREVRGRLPPRSSHKGSRGEGSDLSTSQSQQEGSEPSRTPWSGSDSGSELSADLFAVEA